MRVWLHPKDWRLYRAGWHLVVSVSAVFTGNSLYRHWHRIG